MSSRGSSCTFLSYENPGCKNAWPLAKLDRWLKSNTSWIPTLNEPPYRAVPDRPWTGKVIKKDYVEVQRPGLLEGIGKGGIDTFSSTRHVSEKEETETVRRNQIQWLDIDGDGQCDFIGWDFEHSGISARGEQGHTDYYIFLQRGNGFKLIDYTEIGFDLWGNGQISDAILPVWIKGEKRPFLVGRSDLYFISGESAFVSEDANHNIRYRGSLRWYPSNLNVS